MWERFDAAGGKTFVGACFSGKTSADGLENDPSLFCHNLGFFLAFFA